MILDFTRDTLLGLSGAGIPLFLLEAIDIVIIALALGFIFKDFFRKPAPAEYDPLAHHNSKGNFKFAMAVTAPAVVLHELGHKIVAMAFGIQSQLYASYGFLLLGIMLRLMGSPFLFFVPGFVSHAPSTPAVGILISLAGPFVNLCLWLGSSALLKYTKIPHKFRQILIPTAKINMFLFIFNMIPIPPFDGAALWNLFALFS
jgi:Zn-dependent protease